MPGEVASVGSANFSLNLAGKDRRISSWQHQSEASWPRRKKDHQVLFVVRYRDQPDAYMRVPPALANFGASPPILRAALERQALGEIPPGEIVAVVRARHCSHAQQSKLHRSISRARDLETGRRSFSSAMRMRRARRCVSRRVLRYLDRRGSPPSPLNGKPRGELPKGKIVSIVRVR